MQSHLVDFVFKKESYDQKGWYDLRRFSKGEGWLVIAYLRTHYLMPTSSDVHPQHLPTHQLPPSVQHNLLSLISSQDQIFLMLGHDTCALG